MVKDILEKLQDTSDRADKPVLSKAEGTKPVWKTLAGQPS
jgi:hypothetical protein